MRVSVSQSEIQAVEADLLAVGLCEGEELPAELAAAPGAADAKGGFKKLSAVFPERPARVRAAVEEIRARQEPVADLIVGAVSG